MQTNVQIDAKNLRPSPDHKPRMKGTRMTIEVGFYLFKKNNYYVNMHVEYL